MQHPPYSLYSYLNDLLWIACFASVLLLSLLTRPKRKLVFIPGTLIAILPIIPFTPDTVGGNSLSFLSLLLFIPMGAYSLLYLTDTTRYLSAPSP